MTVRVSIDGAVELRSALRKISKELPSKVVSNANKKAAEVVAKEARNRAPVQSGRGGAIPGGGQLKASIRALGSQRRGEVAMGRARIPYAAVQEFGWPGHNISKKLIVYGAVRAKRPEVIDTYVTELNRELDRVWPR